MNTKTILLQYKEMLIDEDKAKTTINTYLINVSKFLEWLKSRYNENDPAAVTTLDLKEYQNYLLNVKKYKGTGIKQRMMSVTSYCNFLLEKQYIKQNITNNFKLIKTQNNKTAPKIISKVKMNKYRREVYKSNNIRNIAIIEFLKGTGIRVSELIDLETDDIFLSERKGIVKIRKGKGGKYREIPLNNDIRKSLEAYLNIRSNEHGNKLWIGQRGPLTKDAINKMLKKYAIKVGLEQEVHPHMFRHYLAHMLLREKKKDPVLVAYVLGHSDINTLKIYTQPTLTELEEALEDIE